MSQALSLQKPTLFLIVLVLIALSQISLAARAMRMYPTYAPPAAWAQQQQQQQDAEDHHSLQKPPIAATATATAKAKAVTHRPSDANVHTSHSQQRDNFHGIGSRDTIDSHSDAIFHTNADCSGLSSRNVDCSRSPAPEEAEGSEIDPRYGVEKRLVPTGPNPLHN